MLFRKQREFSQLKEIGSTDLGPISQYVVQKQHEVSQLENAGTTVFGTHFTVCCSGNNTRFRSWKRLAVLIWDPFHSMLFRKQQEFSQLEKVGSTDLRPISQYVVQETTGVFAAGKGWQY